MKNYKLDQTLLPEVWVTWMSKDGRIWMNDSGARYNKPQYWMDYDGEYNMRYHRGNNGKIPYGSHWGTRNNDRLWINSGSQLYYAYAKYHEDIDRLEIAAVRYDTTRAEGKHTWHYDGDRFFIGKDKSIVNIDGTPHIGAYNVKRHNSAYNPKDMLSMILRLTHNDKFVNEFKKFIGHNYYIIGNGTSVNIEYGWQLQKWYMSKQKARSTGKAQQLVDKLIGLPLGNIDGLEYKYAPKEKSHYTRYESAYINNIIYFERVNDEWSVLRALIREEDGYFNEAWRVYLGDDGTNRIASKSNNDWVPASQQKGWYGRQSFYFANKDEAIEKCNRIKYIAPMMAPEESINTLITTLRFPCIEQLYKMGQTKLALRIARSSTPMAEMKDIFGDYYKEKEKNVLRQIGMTKYQLDAYCAKRENQSYYGRNIMKRMRETLGDDLSRIDNATFEKYLNALDEILRRFYADHFIDNLNVDKNKFWKNVVRLNEKNSTVAHLISDTINQYHYLRNVRPEIDWLFDDFSDVVRTHDAITELRNEEMREQRAYWNMAEAERRKKDDTKRKEVDEKRKCYEYEDENFVIRLPKDVAEIITEGSKQSICIGGYTSRHSRGETNLFFLRKKSDENTPFYAIEMSNDKNIVQIHGFGNKWLGNNPEAIPTVVRWLRKHNIKCDPKILTCKARGYGRTNDYIEMPKVD